VICKKLAVRGGKIGVPALADYYSVILQYGPKNFEDFVCHTALRMPVVGYISVTDSEYHSAPLREVYTFFAARQLRALL
jgi:hypothetical protein